MGAAGTVQLRGADGITVKKMTVFEIAALRIEGRRKIRVSQITQDKHSNAKTGEVRRWADGKLHIKKAHGWDILQNSKEYDLKEYDEPKARKDLIARQTTQAEFNGFVDKLFNGDYKNAPATVHLPEMNRKLLVQLGIKDNTQFIFKARYPHINPARKARENQGLSKDEYKRIPDVIRNTRTAYIDKEKKNFFILFEDNNKFEMVNKLVFNKTTNGNYLVTLGKVNKKDELASRENLPVSGRS